MRTNILISDEWILSGMVAQKEMRCERYEKFRYQITTFTEISELRIFDFNKYHLNVNQNALPGCQNTKISIYRCQDTL